MRLSNQSLGVVFVALFVSVASASLVSLLAPRLLAPRPARAANSSSTAHADDVYDDLVELRAELASTRREVSALRRAQQNAPRGVVPRGGGDPIPAVDPDLRSTEGGEGSVGHTDPPAEITDFDRAVADALTRELARRAEAERLAAEAARSAPIAGIRADYDRFLAGLLSNGTIHSGQRSELLDRMEALIERLIAGELGEPDSWQLSRHIYPALEEVIGAGWRGRLSGSISNGQYGVPSVRLDERFGVLRPGGRAARALHGVERHIYPLIINSQQSVTIHCAFSHSDGDLDMLLHNSDGGSIASSTGTSDSETITRMLAPGEYEIRLYLCNDPSRQLTNNYTLSVDAVAPQALSLFGIETRTLDPQGEALYVVYVGAQRAVRVTLDGDPDNVDIDIYVTNSSGQQVARGTSGDGNEQFTFNAEPGEYFVRVRNLSSRTSSTFDLTLDVE